MRSAWIALTCSGDPGWRAFDDASPGNDLIFDAAGGGVGVGPRGDERMI
jgi:hypothetical protein